MIDWQKFLPGSPRCMWSWIQTSRDWQRSICQVRDVSLLLLRFLWCFLNVTLFLSMIFKASLKLPFDRVLGILAMFDSGETDWKVNNWIIVMGLLLLHNIFKVGEVQQSGDSDGRRGGREAKYLGHGESREGGTWAGKSCSRFFQAL